MKKARENGEARELDELFERYRRAPESFVFVPLADACRKMGRLDEALEICENGVRRHPDYPSGHVVRGKCLYDRGDLSAARESFSRVLSLDEDNLVALKYLGNIEADEGNLPSAQRHFRRILALDPDNKEIKTILRMVDEQDQSTEIEEAPADDIIERVGEILRAGPVAEDTAEPPEAAPAEEASEPSAADGDESIPERLAEEPALERGAEEPETSGELASVTLAEIFASQGYASKAEKIYREILRRQPGNEDVRRRLSSLIGEVNDASGETPSPVDTTDPERGGAETPAAAPDSGDGPARDETSQDVAGPSATTLNEASEPSSKTRGSSGARPEIQDQDSLSHFRRWLTRVQK